MRVVLVTVVLWWLTRQSVSMMLQRWCIERRHGSCPPGRFAKTRSNPVLNSLAQLGHSVNLGKKRAVPKTELLPRLDHSKQKKRPSAAPVWHALALLVLLVHCIATYWSGEGQQRQRHQQHRRLRSTRHQVRAQFLRAAFKALDGTIPPAGLANRSSLSGARFSSCLAKDSQKEVASGIFAVRFSPRHERRRPRPRATASAGSLRSAALRLSAFLKLPPSPRPGSRPVFRELPSVSSSASCK